MCSVHILHKHVHSPPDVDTVVPQAGDHIPDKHRREISFKGVDQGCSILAANESIRTNFRKYQYREKMLGKYDLLKIVPECISSAQELIPQNSWYH